ncbi:MAG: 2-oxoacid:acceptor oxidoreductase family protein [Lentisphaerae bacterium]|nr:2-oxoacid:acceptor oxidoreductase family protein [Lentisphaerota bacterium]
MADILIRIAGEAGQGVDTTGNMLLGGLSGLGVHLLSTQSFMSRIRGGLNWCDLRVSERECFAGKEQADLLVSFTEVSGEVLSQNIASGGTHLHNCEAASTADIVSLHATEIAKKLTGSALAANSVMAGAVFALLGYPVDTLCAYLEKSFGPKGRDLADANAKCARAGHSHIGEAGLWERLHAPPQSGSMAGQLWSGAAALGLGAATAGVKFVAAYPMSPSTATLGWLAEKADLYGILVEQAEDEIAAINMVCGATYAGVPALTTTSGGGFALMAEGLSLAGMMELPAVVVIAQRPGPATGMPTRTAQQDLQFALRAGHGEFPRAIYAPGTVAQCYSLMRMALQTAHRHQTPALLLTDQFLQDMQKLVPPFPETDAPIDRCLAEDADADYQRYRLPADGGLSPRAIPGGAARVVVDSDEHDAAGHLSEDFQARISQQDKRMVHASQVWPLSPEAWKPRLIGRRRICCVEGNQTAQFYALLRETGILAQAETLLRYDGLPFTGAEIAERIGP